jgi:hypothetical protein
MAWLRRLLDGVAVASAIPMSARRTARWRSRAAHVAVLAWWLLAGVLEAAIAAAHDGPDVRIESVPGGSVIEAHATLRADAQTAWQVLTAYDDYVRFVPGIVASRVVARNGPRVTVVQAMARRWLPWRMEARYDIVERPPGRLESQASGTFGRLASVYRIAAAQDGVTLDYRGTLTPDAGLLALLAAPAAHRAIRDEFDALAREIERQGAAAREPRERARRGAP